MTFIRIRPYEPADLQAVITVFNQAVRQTARRDYGPDQIRAWAPAVVDLRQWSERLDRKPIFVAEHERRIAGFSDLEPGGHIDMMFVHPDHQGRGVARGLLDHVVVQARAQNLRALTTDASVTAKPFFERNGFRVVAAQDVVLRGQTFRNFRMTREL